MQGGSIIGRQKAEVRTVIPSREDGEGSPSSVEGWEGVPRCASRPQPMSMRVPEAIRFSQPGQFVTRAATLLPRGWAYDRHMLIATLVLAAAVAASPIPLDRAQRAFDEIRLASEEEGGRLWGTALYGPMLFVDPETRAVVANRADGEGLLTPAGTLFTGTLPPTVAVANTAVTWSGVKWTMIMWGAVSDTTVGRRRLLLHESFHRIQDAIGFPMANADNAHLDTLEGRYWLILEMRALAAALRSEQRDSAMADAAAFRARRRTLFDAAATNERALENNEGLAEYTGFALRGTSPDETRLAVARWRLDGAGEGGTFVRSFAYATGAAWGLLLDEVAPDWRKRYRAEHDLAATAVAAAKLKLPADAGARCRI